MSEQLGNRIRKFRQLKDIKQSYISRMLGISVSAYGKIERGETHLTIERLQEIGSFLGFSIQDILEPESPRAAHSRQMAFQANEYALSDREYDDLKKILQTLPAILEGHHSLMRKLLQVVERRI